MSEIKERPILFSGPMVKAILAGQKTMTRRVMKPQPIWTEGVVWQDVCKIPGFWTWKRSQSHEILLHEGAPYQPEILAHCPYGRPGERLWVRETWEAPRTFLGAINYLKLNGGHMGLFLDSSCERQGVIYRTDHDKIPDNHSGWKWRPSIHMPRWASRITLEITGVKVERLQDISHEDAIAEGMEDRDAGYYGFAVTSYAVGNFRLLWEAINGNGSWKSNPWVWCVSFQRIEGEP